MKTLILLFTLSMLALGSYGQIKSKDIYRDTGTIYSPNQPAIGDHEVIVQMTLHLEGGHKSLITEVWTNGQMREAYYVHEIWRKSEALDEHHVVKITDSTRQAQYYYMQNRYKNLLI